MKASLAGYFSVRAASEPQAALDVEVEEVVEAWAEVEVSEAL